MASPSALFPLWDDCLYHASALIAWIKYAQTVVLLLRSYVAWCSLVGVTPTQPISSSSSITEEEGVEEEEKRRRMGGGILITE